MQTRWIVTYTDDCAGGDLSTAIIRAESADEAMDRFDDLNPDTGWAVSHRSRRPRRGAQGAAMTRKPTIYEVLRRKLGRSPTNQELREEIQRILTEARVESAYQRKFKHQRRRY